jgi:glycerol-3-phosphate O-acyltransferase
MPILPDISIEWILQTYVSHLKPKGETLHLIPIGMTYERLFEIDSIAKQNMSGTRDKMSATKIVQMVKQQS